MMKVLFMCFMCVPHMADIYDRYYGYCENGQLQSVINYIIKIHVSCLL